MKFNRSIFNILCVSFGFLCNLSAYNALLNAQKYIFEAIKSDNPAYKADAYIGLCITFGVSSITNWFAPVIIILIGPRSTMCLGMFINTLYLLQLLFHIDWLFYIGCVMSGIGGSLMWTAVGHYLTLNSTKDTIQRNSGIFWAIIQISAIIGNLYIYIVIKNDTVTKNQRQQMFIVMAILALFSAIIMIIIRRAVHKTEPMNALQIFIQEVKLLIHREMLLLSITYFYSGFVLSFYLGVYSNAVGFTNSFKEIDTTLISISGMLIGAGEVVGGTLFGILGHKTIRWGHYPIVITGFIIHVMTYTFILINLPDSATNGPTDDSAFIESNIYLAYACAFLLGFGDACYITQIFGMLGSVFAKKSASAFALFKFVQSVACAIAYLYTAIGLHRVLYILYIFSVLGTVSFCVVEWLPRLHIESSDNNLETN